MASMGGDQMSRNCATARSQLLEKVSRQLQALQVPCDVVSQACAEAVQKHPHAEWQTLVELAREDALERWTAGTTCC